MSRHVKRLVALTLLPLLVMLTGCIRLRAEYEILSIEEVRISMDLGILNSASEETGTEDPAIGGEELCGIDIPEGVNTELYTEEGDDGYAGCRSTGVVLISDLNDEEGTTLQLVDGVWNFALSVEEGSEDDSDPDLYSDFQVSVTFPGEVLTYSGSPQVDGTTVTWTDAEDYLTAEGLTATARNGSTIPWLIIALAVAALAGIGAIIVLLMRGRKNTSGVAAWNQHYGPGFGPGPLPQPGQQYPPQGGPTYAGPEQGQPHPPRDPAHNPQQFPGQGQ